MYSYNIAKFDTFLNMIDYDVHYVEHKWPVIHIYRVQIDLS